MWQFPALVGAEIGSVRSGNMTKDYSALRAAVAKHLRLSLGLEKIKSAQLESADDSRHTVTFRRIRLVTFLARVARLPRLPNACTPRLKEVAHLAVSSATKKIAAAALRALAAAPATKS
jgi:hypothetical protein